MAGSRLPPQCRCEGWLSGAPFAMSGHRSLARRRYGRFRARPAKTARTRSTNSERCSGMARGANMRSTRRHRLFTNTTVCDRSPISASARVGYNAYLKPWERTVANKDEIVVETAEARRRIRDLENAIANMVECPGSGHPTPAGETGPGLCDDCKRTGRNLLGHVTT